jgi:short-subunit dehydrogenase
MRARTVLVTGATGNVGGGAATALAKRGVRVVLIGRKAETLQRRADAIRATLPAERRGGDIDLLPIDFSDMDSVRRGASEALSRYEAIDSSRAGRPSSKTATRSCSRPM